MCVQAHVCGFRPVRMLGDPRLGAAGAFVAILQLTIVRNNPTL